jgi:ribosomal-protein-alanine N-acetyltransferase
MNFAIRPMQLGDIPQVLAMEQPSDGAAHWSREIYEEFLRASSLPAVKKFALVAEADSALLGFVIGRVVLLEAELENIVVDAASHRQGVALALFDALAHSCQKAGAVELRLQVREGNSAARAFYTRAEFLQEARRPAYYRNPEEAALVLRKELRQPPQPASASTKT